MNLEENEAKNALDKLIDKGRVHLYKPIQIAEILYYDRHHPDALNLLDKTTFQSSSKTWRDTVTYRLLGTASSSSARYQDDVFNPHAMPPQKLNVLGKLNRLDGGIVENYIYQKFRERQGDVITAYEFLNTATVDSFRLDHFLNIFERKKGLKRSVDKVYEIITYALFTAIIDELDVTVEVKIENYNRQVLDDFASFIQTIFGSTDPMSSFKFKAQLYRNGVTNAADRGLDMWANFGPIVQVKHVSLTNKIANDISTSVSAENIIVVCKHAEAKLIRSLLIQLGLRIKGIVTQNELEEWYAVCLSKYSDSIGQKLIEIVKSGFSDEFVYVESLEEFLAERQYDISQLIGNWALNPD